MPTITVEFFHNHKVQLSVKVLTTWLAVQTIVTVMICYICAVILQHRLGYLPTISETGDYSPEAGIFSFGLSLSGFILILFIFILYMLRNHYVYMVKDLVQDQELIDELNSQNRFNLFYGIVSALCLNLTATFRSLEVPIVHYIAASLLFASSWCFMITGTMLDEKIRVYLPEKISLQNLRVKWVIVLIGSLALFGLFFFFVLYLRTDNNLYWNAFALCEYSLLLSFCSFCFSFWNCFADYQLSLRLIHSSGEEPPVLRYSPDATEMTPLLVEQNNNNNWIPKPPSYPEIPKPPSEEPLQVMMITQPPVPSSPQ